jgi:hypothetical protein
MKVLFAPVGIVAGLIAGLIARKGFDRLWSAVADEEAPNPDQREVSYRQLVPALLVEGATFRVVKGVVDHGARRGFFRLTGRWPGEERPEPA